MGMTKHPARPKDGTITRQNDGTPADGTSDDDYPLQAECQSCNRVLTVKTPQDTRWRHAGTSTRKPAAKPTPAGSPDHRS